MRTFITKALVAATGLGLAVAAPIAAASSAQALPAIMIYKVQYDSPGSDTGSNASLNAEYVFIKNLGSSTATLTGYTLRDAQGHVYKFGTYRLGAHQQMVVHTGKGTNNASHRYWGQSNYIWNNTGDRATLRAANGTTVDTCSWGATGSYKNC